MPHDDSFVSYSLFRTVTPKTTIERDDVPWEELLARLRDAPAYIDKAHCPLISLAQYGKVLSEKGCIRHAANVQRVFGGEIDYDGERIAPDEAARLLTAANIRAAIYTSPRHRPEAPRWRVLLPFSEPALPDKRAEYVARGNRVLGGIATSESFALSQSFYVGRVEGVTYLVLQTEGRCIDLAAEIDPLYPSGGLNGSESRFDSTTDEELRAAFGRGEDRYQAMLKLSSRWAARGMPVDDIESALGALFGSGSTKNAQGIDLRGRVRGIAESAVKKFGESRASKPVVQITPPRGRSAPEENPEQAAVEARSGAAALSFVSLKTLTHMTIARKIALVENLLFPGAWLVTGRPKIGKSWLLLQLALAVAEGETFLGLNCQTASVLAVFGEDDDARIKGRLEALGVGRAPDNCFFINHKTLRELGRRFADHLTFEEFLGAWIEAHPAVKLVVLDTETTVRQVWRGERTEDASPQVTERDYKQTRTFDDIALRHSIVVLLVNHAGKRKGGEYVDFHEMINRSNTALAGCSGSIVLADPPDADPFDPKSKQRVLAVRGRDLQDDILLGVHQDVNIPLFVSDGPYVEVRQTQAEAEIIEALIEIMPEIPAGEYVSSEDVASHLGRNRATVRRTVTRMLAANRTVWKRSKVTAKRGKKGGIRLDPLGGEPK